MPSLVEIIAPRRLGTGFRWLLGSSWLNNLGDGISIAAGPLLVASLTSHAVLIASAALLQWLPPLLFGLWAGALSDRIDRKAIVLAVESLRALMVVVLCVTIVAHVVSIPVVLVLLFLLSVADVFGTNATSTFLPMLVRRDDLAIGNARVSLGFATVNQLIGPPVGAALFAAGRAVPFVAEAVVVTFSVLMVTRIVLPRFERQASGRGMRGDIAEGFRWVRRHAAIRTLVLTIFTFNITFGAAWSVLVLYATQRLGLHAFGFGLITTVEAIGGLVGTSAYGWIVRRVSLGNIMRVGLIIETLTHLGLALATTPWVAMPIFFVFGAHAFVWNTTSTTVRQRAVPTELQGRVGSVNMVGVFGGLVIGSGIGGVLAQRFGVTAPFWFAFGGSAVFLVAIWRQLVHIAHDDPGPADTVHTAEIVDEAVAEQSRG